ncbi:sialate O-acetylesterase [Roseateles sp. BYS180W]|uniref:Sialate O-acetylesterase n=1 Tax=Roseateles rivi TaxID=3299028 RepID=A0ABW7FUZ9_9BURK
MKFKAWMHALATSRRWPLMLAGALGGLLTAGAAWSGTDWDIPSDKTKFHVFIIGGQSNASGVAPLEAGDTNPVPHVLRIPTVGNLAWGAAAHPLHNRLSSDQFGLGLDFARQYMKTHPGVTVGLIPVAWGGAPISYFAKGSVTYQDIITKVNFAKQSGVLKGMLWQQGESDTVYQSLADAYEAALHTLISNIRADTGEPNLPFVAGEVGSFYGAPDDPEHLPNISRIRTLRGIFATLPSKVSYTAFVSSAELGHIGDHVHFNRASLITLGQRHADALATAKSQRPAMITPSSISLQASHELNHNGSYYAVSHLIDGSGLSSSASVTNAGTVTHSSSLANTWCTLEQTFPNYVSSSANPNPVLVATLPTLSNIQALVTWGYGDGGPGSGNSAAKFLVEFSSDQGQTYPLSETVSTTHLLQSASQTLQFRRSYLASHIRVTVLANAAGLGHGGSGGDRHCMSELRFVGYASQANASYSVIKPSSISQDVGSSEFPLINIINASGLNAEPTVGGLNGSSHVLDGANVWATWYSPPQYFDGSNPNPRMTLTLPSAQTLEGLILWGYGGIANAATNFDLEFSANGGTTWSSRVTVNTTSELGLACEVLSFPAVRANAVRMTVHGNARLRSQGSQLGGDRVGISEIRFLGRP